MQDDKPGAAVVADSTWQARLSERISAALDSLACADMAVAALRSAQGHPRAAIWAAIDGGHPSIRPALALSEAEMRSVAASWPSVAGCSFSGAAAAAPWVSCFQATPHLRPGYTSALLQVRPLLPPSHALALWKVGISAQQLSDSALLVWASVADAGHGAPVGPSHPVLLLVYCR